MASVNSVSGSSSASSLYGNKNVLSGLASGLDTEAMIENSISGYQTKLTQLEQEQTKIQWKQESFREIIDKAVNLNNKYSSYTSSTNLMGGAFFTGASGFLEDVVSVLALGALSAPAGTATEPPTIWTLCFFASDEGRFFDHAPPAST